jgi:hypothetical protein
MQKLKINKIPDKKNNDVRYYIACTVRNGNKCSTRNLESLGKRNELIKDHPDLDAYLKSKLDETMKSGKYDSTVEIKYSFDRKIKPGDVKRYDVGDIFIRRLMNEINFGDYLDELSKKYKFEYSLSDVITFLLSQRLITPFSKRKMYLTSQKSGFMTPSFALHDVYRALDILIENKTDILKYLYKNVPCKLTRNYSILYFDGTNTYMETEIEEGLKARGKGKRNEIEPLVSLGLILDGSGIPVSYVTFKGSGSECKQLIPLEKILEKDFKHTDFVMITDSALSSKEIRCFNSICNKNYITVSPVRKMSEEKLKKYIFNDKEWKTNDKNYTTPEQLLAAYRSLEEEKEKDPSIEKTDIFESKMNDLMNVFLTKRTKALDDVKPKEYRTNVNEVEYIPEDYIVSFSLKYLYREELQRERILKKAQNMVTKDGVKENYKPSDPRKYINKVSYTKDGEVAENTLCGINEELVLKEKRLDGYYAVVTSLTEEDDENIIHWMKQRWMIEDTFLVMKQFFGFRPINHSKDNRIDAHFFSVFLTTLFYRYIQKICNDSDYNSLKNLSDEEILDILKVFSITETKSYYFPNFDNDQKKQDIQELFNVNLSNEIMKKTYVTKEFKKKISKK